MGGLSFDAVVFDADGTLFDTETLMHQVWWDVGREMNFTRPAEEYLDFVGLNRTAMLKRMEGYDASFDRQKFIVGVSEGLQARIEREGVPLKPGVRELLAFLSQNGIPMALATSTHRIRTDRRLELSGLAQHFRATVTGDEVSHGKPDPEMYLTACRKLGADPARCLAVEDSRNGILSAHAAGMTVFMVPDLIPPTDDLCAMARKFDSLSEILTCFM